MPSVRLPPREMLRRLLDSGKLTPSEAEAARKMYDDLVAGRIGGLSHQQGVWTRQLCQRCGIGLRQVDPIASRKKAKEEKERQLAEFDAMPRPKKPPGRR